MSFTIKHAFVSAKSDGLDTSFVQPSNWNADHELEFTGDDVFLGRSAGAGPGAAEEISLTQYTVPIGAVLALAHSTLPSTGWLWANNQAVNRTTYANLFAKIGTAFGVGDGSSTFNLPDLRGRVIAGLDNLGGAASAARLNSQITSSITMGSTGGTQEVTLGVGQIGLNAGGGQIITNGNTGAGIATLAAGADVPIYAAGSASPGAHSNTQPTMVMNFVIRY